MSGVIISAEAYSNLESMMTLVSDADPSRPPSGLELVQG